MSCSYTNVTVTGYNASPPPDDGSEVSGNVIEWAKHKEKLGDPLKTAIESMDSNIDSMCSGINTEFALKATITDYSNTHAAAYLSSNQGLTQNTWDKIVLDSEDYDVNSNFASGTYTVPSDGKYLITASVRVGTLADGNPVNYAIRKNGSLLRQFADDNAGNGTVEVQLSGAMIADLAATDTIELYAKVETSGDSATGDAGGSRTWMQIVRLV